jgi:hypothetical protein
MRNALMTRMGLLTGCHNTEAVAGHSRAVRGQTGLTMPSEKRLPVAIDT